MSGVAGTTSNTANPCRLTHYGDSLLGVDNFDDVLEERQIAGNHSFRDWIMIQSHLIVTMRSQLIISGMKESPALFYTKKYTGLKELLHRPTSLNNQQY